MTNTGPYIGIVEKNDDPNKMGRLKVRVPSVYGVSNSPGNGYVPTNSLPWCLPSGTPAGGTAISGGMDWIPETGDQVLVWLLDGQPENPVWTWGNQSIPQADAFQLHKYSEETKKPNRAAITKYGHTIEVNSGSIILTTANGYVITLNNGSGGIVRDGKMEYLSPKGNHISVEDSTDTYTLLTNQDIILQAGSQLISYAQDHSFESLTYGFNVVAATDIGLASDTMTLNSASLFSLKSPVSVIESENISLGLIPSEPYVLGNQLVSLINLILVWLSSHSHSNGNNGSPTGPPIVPPQPTINPQIPTILSKNILGS